MHRRTLLAAGAAALAQPLRAHAAAHDNWPTQPVRLIVPFSAGGPTDIPARLFADELSQSLPQRIVVENRTGAGVVVGSEVVAKAPKDGNTLLYNTIAHSVLKPLFPRLNFDPVADFQPVALVGVIPMVITVNKDFPVRTLPELAALLKKHPGKYDYASSGNGGALHLASELFLRAAGAKANHVPYRGVAPAMPDVLNGTIPIIIDVATTALPYVQRGETRALAVMSSKRIATIPDVPTTAEAGFPGLEAYTWHMVLAPAGTPMPLVQQVNAAFNRVAAMPSVQQKLADLAMDLRSDSTPESATAFLRNEAAKWEGIIRDAGIKVD
ncbi:tripartite tricarboxylate transporter substrate binding protein [Siccirubricoccus sp. KC 17139]|uniref:Tripartite tricarboxylate transporter substrate binding protein n=1 Tax=Siccirubricoccus soli TaxID=2899147 RepID=A0ABT1CYH5_9PROT|nr:tripartite tricarboxylate transporter substrate binding protein [Siccirubricoccus soli]MCO6414706.1 tripartite tricarboxylate transporter substrate binding protein [Siccirubricoccus soli]MCP2680836.1 tripartite tricarboxylate transporter substrate binding protein [Siccirubricoccus soli]